MYNLNMYTYSSKPFNETVKFTVHSLNEPGVKTYTGPESHCVHYLHRTDPKVYRQIMKIGTCTEPDEILLEKGKSKDLEEKKEPEINKQYMKTEIPAEDTNKYTKEIQKDEENNQNQITNEKEGFRFNRTFTNGFDPCFRSTGFAGRTKRPYNKRKNFQEIYGYDRFSGLKTKKEKYLHEIKELKNKKLTGSEFNYTHTEFNFPKKKYDGFTSFAVPRTLSSTKRSPVFTNYENRIRNSVGRSMKNIKANNEYEILRKDNEDMKRKLRLMTDTNIMEEYKLPDICNIANNKMKIRNINCDNNKEFGEKYNPYCLTYKTGDLIGRNYVGALFNH